jgi:hypothetical protein
MAGHTKTKPIVSLPPIFSADIRPMYSSIRFGLEATFLTFAGKAKSAMHPVMYRCIGGIARPT